TSIRQFVSTSAAQPSVSVHVVTNQRGRITVVEFITQVPAISSSSGAATGTVTYYLGSRPFTTVPVNNGKATLRLTAGQVLDRLLFVKYSGDTAAAPTVSGSMVITGALLRQAARSQTQTLPLDAIGISGGEPAVFPRHAHSLFSRAWIFSSRTGRHHR